MRATSREVKKLESGALSVVQEVLTGLRVVKAFGQEDREQERFVGRSSAGMRARIRLRLIEGGYALLVGAIIGAGRQRRPVRRRPRTCSRDRSRSASCCW